MVTRAQLLRAGVTAREIQRRLESGALLPVHRGVYRVGHRAPSIEARYMAAVRAGGDEALLSGRAAAYLLGVVKGKPPPPEVTVPTDRRIKGVKTRRSTQRDATVWRGIPVTTVPRTLVDLAPYLPEEDLARACHEAGVRHHTTPAKVEAVLARRPNSPGAGKAQRRPPWRGTGIAEQAGASLPVDLLRERRPPPAAADQPSAGAKRVDCRWPEHQLTVELDSYRYHYSRHAWEQDRRREREAHARGDEFRRYTWGDVFEHPAAMLAELRVLLPTISLIDTLLSVASSVPFIERLARIPLYSAGADSANAAARETASVAMLASNESPFPPVPEVVEAVQRAAGEVNRYPDPGAGALRRALADRYDYPMSSIAVGNGSCEILLAAAEALLEPWSELVYAWPAFSMYPHLRPPRTRRSARSR